MQRRLEVGRYIETEEHQEEGAGYVDGGPDPLVAWAESPILAAPVWVVLELWLWLWGVCNFNYFDVWRVIRLI